jgi:hypothetical protein
MKRKGICIPDGVQSYSKNPFLRAMGIVFFKTGSRVLKTGEDSFVRSVNRVISDNRSYTKVFTNTVKKNVPELFSMDLKTTRLFIWLLLNVTPNEDYLELNAYMLMDDLGLTKRKEVEDAVLSLIKLNVIVPMRGVENHFWINTSLFYNGDRKALVKDEFGKLDLGKFEYTGDEEDEKKKGAMKPNEDFL